MNQDPITLADIRKMKRHELKYLKKIREGHFDNLVLETHGPANSFRVWVSRVNIGEVTVEKLENGCWVPKEKWTAPVD